MKILVTGGAGFIGVNFIYYLLEKYDYDVVCIDSLTYAADLTSLNLAFESNRFKFIKGDITNEEFINKTFLDEKFDIVVNFAAESDVDRSIINDQLFLLTNIIGTGILLRASLKNRVKRFHQVSTDEVYGDQNCANEKNFLNPSNPYSASKAAADLLVIGYYKTYGLNVTISRSANNYGPFQYPEKLVSKAIIKALKNEDIHLYGDGEHKRNWLFVEDHVRAIDLIIHKGKSGEIYNINGDYESSNTNIVKKIKEITKSNSAVYHVEDRLGHDKHYQMDTQKIKDLGWIFQVDFNSGINLTINWYKNNSLWWQKKNQ